MPEQVHLPNPEPENANSWAQVLYGVIETVDIITAFGNHATIPRRSANWGGHPGSKRIGRMVVGAMADPPRGIKSYPDFRQAEGVTDDVWAELRVMEDEYKRAVIGAIQAGMTVAEAFTLVYRAMS